MVIEDRCHSEVDRWKSCTEYDINNQAKKEGELRNTRQNCARKVQTSSEQFLLSNGGTFLMSSGLNDTFKDYMQEWMAICDLELLSLHISVTSSETTLRLAMSVYLFLFFFFVCPDGIEDAAILVMLPSLLLWRSHHSHCYSWNFVVIFRQ